MLKSTVKSKRWLVVTALVAGAVWCCWLTLAPSPWEAVRHNWQVALTMIFGSMIAGATCEGGGAVAFPVFTKVLNIGPHDAKVFALAIQSVGMTAAAATIFAMRVRVDLRCLGWTSLGGAVGMVAGLHVVAPHVPPALVRVLFTMLQCGLAATLLLMMRRERSQAAAAARARRADLSTPGSWQVLLLTGLVGGVVGSLFGHGVDVLVFSVMVLLFRVSEKVATPTTVVLMAGNAVVGFAACLQMPGEFHPAIQGFWLAAVPVVVLGAPLGAVLCQLLRRSTIVAVLIFLIGVETATTIWLVPLTPQLALLAAAAFLTFTGAYLAMSRCRRFWPAGPRSLNSPLRTA